MLGKNDRETERKKDVTIQDQLILEIDDAITLRYSHSNLLPEISQDFYIFCFYIY